MEIRERLRPVIKGIIEGFADTPDDAAEMILRLLDDPQASPPAPASPAPKASASGARRKRAAAGANTRIRPPPPLPTEGRQLTPLEWYTIEETVAFIGVRDQTIRNIMRDEPDLLPHRRVAPEGSSFKRTEIQGRHILALRERRDRQSRGEEPLHEGVQ